MSLGTVALAACTSSSVPAPSGTGPPSEPSTVPPISMYAAGDVASCESDGDEATAALLDELLAEDPGNVLALGDLAYEQGTAEEFRDCYAPSWGRFLQRTIPTPGNHEYVTDRAAPYFDYFGAAAGTDGRAWHAIAFRSWHVVVLDSNCDKVDCGEETRWLEESMASVSPGPGWCTLAIWHHPRWSSGSEHGSDRRTDALWRILHDGGADLVLTGHDHEYERFVPMNAAGDADPTGMVEFVVGTGGRSLYDFARILPTSAVHDSSTYGVLKLTLHPSSYDWAFVPTTDGGFTDSGSADCR
jgi:hypothetical protein